MMDPEETPPTDEIEPDPIPDQEEDKQSSDVVLVANVIEASKDGEVVKYTIQTKEIMMGDESEERGHVVVRELDDFEWLDHCIKTQNDISGIIFPPLMTKHHVTALAAENKSKKQLGNKTKSMLGDEFTKECRSLEKYIQLLLVHPMISKDVNLRKFLIDEELPPRVKVKKGILNSLSKTVDEVRFTSHKDINDEFQSRRNFVNKYSTDIKSCTEAFTKMVNSQFKVASDLACFANTASFSITDGVNSKEMNRYLLEFASCLEKSRESQNVMAINDEKTLGFTLELYTNYMDGVKSMFLQRTQKLVKLESAQKALQKAKPQNQQELEEAKNTAEEEFQDISEKCEKEFSRFQRQRVLTFQSSLTKFTEAHISNARDTYAMLAKLLSDVKSI
ncbi:sorting nexin-5-like [Dendronephthya gigantea]|uniref:sorting nexin-5-like n=1 Tax=Dendronephthya gigantea TaxID=151771 RepID=UPI001069C8CD|nr:sorting nexin-5-like [Dendronephthya gigantea]